jgi:hypothetical protein
VTIAIRPSLVEAGWRDETTDFGKTEAKYFSREDWTVESTLNCFMNFDFARMRLSLPLNLIGTARSRLAVICPSGALHRRRANHTLTQDRRR